MPSPAEERAQELVALIDQALVISAEIPALLFPSEAKPVGPYATFGECVTAMQNRDYTEEEARRICGAMEQQSGKRVRTGRADQRYLHRLLRATRPIQKAFEADLRRSFDKLGERVARAYMALKDAGDSITVELTLNRADISTFGREELTKPFQRAYTLMGEVTYAAVSERLGVALGWNLEDYLARQVVALGGRRAGLVDILEPTRHALFEAIVDARSQGEGPIDLARRIRQYVPAGRFVGLEAEREGRGVAYRSELIGRTETTYARNVSAIAAGGQAGFDRYLVFDARLGPTDAECEALDGEIVDAQRAAELIAEEHPNGTRSISPVPRS